MRNRRSVMDHSEAVARRLALLNAELGVQPPQGEAGVEWAGPTRISGTPWPEDDLDDEDDDGAPGEAEVAEGAGQQAVPAHGSGLRPGLREVRGRHAARPGVGRLSALARLVDGAGATSRAPGQVAVVLAGLVLALAVTCGWLLLGGSSKGVVEVEPLAARQTATVDTSTGPGAAVRPATTGPAQPVGGSDSEVSSGPEVVVHVAGKVRRPGIVVLPAGARVADALDRAGGARRGVDTSGLNLARVLLDGEQVLVGEKASVGVPGVPPGAGPAAATGPGGPSGALVNVNTAPQAELETLPGVGPVMASAIIEWRTTHGGFASVGDLLEVKGIGEATLSRLTPLVTL